MIDLTNKKILDFDVMPLYEWEQHQPGKECPCKPQPHDTHPSFWIHKRLNKKDAE